AAHRRLNADLLQVSREGERNGLDSRAAQHDFESQRLAGLRIDHTAALQLIARIVQHADSYFQVLTQLLRIAVDRVLVGLRKDPGRHLILYLVEDLKLPALRKAGRGKLGTEEEAV